MNAKTRVVRYQDIEMSKNLQLFKVDGCLAVGLRGLLQVTNGPKFKKKSYLHYEIDHNNKLFTIAE